MAEDKTKSTIGMVLEAFSERKKEKISVSSDTVVLLSALSNTRRYKKIDSVPKGCKNTSGNCLPRFVEENNQCKTCSFNKETCANGKNDYYLGELIHQCKRESGSELYWEDLCYGELNQSILVKPALNNNRIVQQQGCFIMCGFNPRDFNKPPESFIKFFFIPDAVKAGVSKESADAKPFKWKRCIILPDNLSCILSKLKTLEIDRYYIYPDLEKDIEVRKASVSHELN